MVLRIRLSSAPRIRVHAMTRKLDSRQSALRELHTIGDWIRYGASRFNRAELHFGHGYDSALDEASQLVLHTLSLPHDLPPAYASARLLPNERKQIHARIVERVRTRKPLAYILGEAWFAGLAFKSSPAALVPRSPIAELIEAQFQPWLADAPQTILDLCTGSGCIAIACAVAFPQAQVVGSDVSAQALALAEENAALHGVSERSEWISSDLFEAVPRRHFDLIVSNPPYVGQSEYDALPGEFAHEPANGLISGMDGLDLPLRILVEAADHLSPSGLLVLEVGASEDALLEQLPDIPGQWAEFERGGSGVLVISAAELRAYRPVLERAIRERAED
jgi:ribosomal protein L3 glutamine methyltransferase